VVRTSGTILSATVSLGYDVPHGRAEAALLDAAARASLEDGFVRVDELGDFSVTYRAAGLLTEVKGLLSARSRLQTSMLDALHEAGIEIVSPTFMNTRSLQAGQRFVPDPRVASRGSEGDTGTPEAIAFDKAEEAESLARLQRQRTELEERIAQLRTELSKAADDAKEAVAERILILERQRDRLAQRVEARQTELREGSD